MARRLEDPEPGRRALRRLIDAAWLRVIVHDFPFAARAARLAADLRLRGADAVYVVAAHVLNIPLVTWDREQHERASTVVAVQAPG